MTSPPRAMFSELQLNVFTLNCWGIPLVSKDRTERVRAIAEYVARGKHNIVCLQEIWSEGDFIYIRDEIKNILPFSHYFYSGVVGSGLCVFSKWNIEDVFFHQWPLNGYIHKIHHGDWFGGKGVGLCRIKCHDWLINVYCTHLHAEYHADDIYIAHRVLQAYSTAEFVKLTTGFADITILAGDLNTEPGNLSFRLLTQIPALLDPLNTALADDETVKYRAASGTSDNSNNSYANLVEVQQLPQGKRIDHILYQTNPMIQAKVLDYGNPLPDRVPGRLFSYSDHNAVGLELQLMRSKEETRIVKNDESLSETLKEAVEVCKEAKQVIFQSRKAYLMYAVSLFLLLLSTVGVWQHSLLQNLIRIAVTGLCFYCFVMGSIWNRIELNSLKSGLSALENLVKSTRSIEKSASEHL